MKKPETLVREYARHLPDDDLRFLKVRFYQLYEGDRSDIAECLSQDKEIDKWLASAVSAEEWFDMLDFVGDCVHKEVRRRSAPPMKERTIKPPVKIVSEIS